MLSALPQSKIFSGALFARQVRSSRLFQKVEEVVYTREYVVLALRHAQSTLGVRSKLPGQQQLLRTGIYGAAPAVTDVGLPPRSF